MKHSQWIASLAALSLLLGGLVVGCGKDHPQEPSPQGQPVMRVRLIGAAEQITLAAANAPTIKLSSESAGRKLSWPAGASVPLTLTANGWRLGSVHLGGGELQMIQPADGAVTINGQAYRGHFRFVPVSATQFDVVNDVGMDAYLMGVVAKEMFASWKEEAYCAQAIAARTYAYYEARTSPAGRHWDVLPDERSQVYGGIGGESAKSRWAVERTAGVVLAAGSAGNERIFKAYFSSCCGGITQSSKDAFRDPYQEVLSERNHGTTCNRSTKFSWGPIVVSKEELTRRFRQWGLRRDRAEKDMATVATIEIRQLNRLGRPINYVITDVRTNKYSLSAEEMRTAINTEGAPGTTVWSGFFKPVNDSTVIRFVDGHGYGHGVGMCQWCAQARAEAGMRHEDILALAYPTAKLVRAY